MPRELRCDVVSSELLEQLILAPLPLGLESGAPVRSFYREIYLDTSDDRLQRTGVSCCLRVASDGGAELTVEIGSRARISGESQRFSTNLKNADVRSALSSATEPVRRLAAIVDPREIESRLELDVERHTKHSGHDWLRRPAIAIHFERVKVKSENLSRSFQQITLENVHGEDGEIERIAAAYSDKQGLRTIAADTRERAQLLLKWMVNDQRGRGTSQGSLALLLIRGTEIAVVSDANGFGVPRAEGSGVGTARNLLDTYEAGRGSDPRLLGKVDSIGAKPDLEVWAARVPDRDSAESNNGFKWMAPTEALRKFADSAIPQFDSIAALSLGVRSGALAALDAASEAAAEQRGLTGLHSAKTGELHVEPDDFPFLNSEISILDFNTRVIAMAEDLSTPLRERFRFLSIASSNVDEFFMVRVAALKQLEIESVEEAGQSPLTPQEQLELIGERASALISRQYRCFESCMHEAEEKGIAILPWSGIGGTARAELREYFRDEIFPGLTPLAMTLSAGHPFPRLAHLSLSLAVVVRDTKGAAPHFAHVELPAGLPRFVKVPSSSAVIAVEELVRANLDLLYPGLEIEQAYAFRVTRGADISLDEDNAWSLLHAVDEATKSRYENPVVRVEVESDMPVVIRELVLKELQRESGFPLSRTDIYEIAGLLDLRALDELSFPDDPALSFPGFSRKQVFPEGDIWSHIAERDRLVHHPFEDFDTTVVRFFESAAKDPDVVAIKATLYRAGDNSPVVAALIDAAKAGKDVVAFVELKARFEEERNVGWAKKLQEAGGKMVFGFRKLKTHAKTSLVVRREGGKLRRYVHIGTGNYNSSTAKRYTDLSLFSADAALSADVNDLFNELTGSSSAPQPLSRGCLIAPRQILSGFIERIDREAAHARAGRGGVIRMKLNGLSDPDVINAMYRASQDGVNIQLVVRAICTLRPGVAGLSENISVTSVVGRFLEHGRVYHFRNGGEDEYFIGSPDLRPRNLRRRIELIAPVRDAECRAELDSLLSLYIKDPGAWELQGDGEYVRRAGGGISAQEQLLSSARTPR